MTGIYKITNLLNENAYIGLSVNIEKRWKDHTKRAFDPKSQEYNKTLYKAFRKYGLENFRFEVLEECQTEDLNEREKYWITYFNTYHGGYNETPGGDGVHDQKGEKHPNHSLTESDVIEIREMWASKTISARRMYLIWKDKIGKSGFKKIYTWQTWKDILPELNTEENRTWHRNNPDNYASRSFSKITEEQFLDIKTRYERGEDLKEIYKEYSDLYSSLESFRSSMYQRFKNS